MIKKTYEEFNEEYGKEEVFDINKPLELIAQSVIIEKSTTFTDTKNFLENKAYQITEETKTVEEIAKSIANQFKSRNREAELRNIKSELVFEDGKSEMDKLPTFELIKEYIYKCMKLCNITGDRLTYNNIEKINGKFTGLLRKKRTSAGYKKVAQNDFNVIETKNMQSSSYSYTALKNDSAIFFSSNYKNELEEEQLEIFDFMREELQGKQSKEINVYNFKTPHNFVVVNKNPERLFLEILTKKDVAQKIDCWVKSRNVAFYSLSYNLKRGVDPKDFNPDFFIKVKNNIIVIETKADNDLSRENYSKMIDAQKHFSELNEKLKELNKCQRYYFNMLSPSSYPTFEAMLKDETYFNGFLSDLEDKLKKEYPNKND